MRNSLEVPDNVAINFFTSHVNGVKTSNTYHARCPVCGDSERNKFKRRMYLLKKKSNWFVYCHNCGYSRSLLLFAKDFFPIYYNGLVRASVNDFFFDEKKEESNKLNNLIGDLYKKTKKPKTKKENPVMEYIKTNCVPMIPEKCFAEYTTIVKQEVEKLRKRRLSEELISSCYFAIDGDYTDRVIIPFYDEDKEPYYFQAMATKSWQMHKKYTNWTEKGNEQSKPLYNEKYIDSFKTVYIVEGLFDSTFVKNSVATCGVTLSRSKIKSLINKFPERVWIMDNDKEGIKRSKILFEMGESCVLFPKEYKKVKDLNDLAILLKKDDLTENIKKYTYNGISGLIEITRL